MSDQFPLVINFQGDYGMKLMLVDPQSTIEQVAAKAKDTLVGIVVKPLPEGATLKVLRHGDTTVLDGKMKVSDANFVKMEALDIIHSS